MRAKAKKDMVKKIKKASSQLLVSSKKKSEDADFLPLEGGPRWKLPDQTPVDNNAKELYIGRIPHGFYEKEMEGSEEKLAFCKDLGTAVCINYKTEDFAARVKEETGGKGLALAFIS
ncbi:uncharacterized protein LOC122650675 [Telopea speciosissima]|uniref:uncharacterized protein LOC122650675 n=1 Tax=Telopea speciosissima TaxID=54955 RepID=UPI001CC36C92|nr:uncharacterized protein LOC122650675 [Telopea speciosissima]